MAWEDVTVELRRAEGKTRYKQGESRGSQVVIEATVQFDQWEIWVQAPESKAAEKPPVFFGVAPEYPGDQLLQLVQVEHWPEDLKAAIVSRTNEALIAKGLVGGRTLAGIYGQWEDAQADTEEETSDDRDLDLCH